MITALIKLEIRRLFSRRSTYLIALGGVATILLSAVGNSHGVIGALRAGRHTPEYTTRYLVGMAFALTLFSAVIGALAVTRDNRTQTAATLYVCTARRRWLHLAKAIAAVLAGAALGAFGLLASVAATHLLLAAHHEPFRLGAGAGWLLAGYVLTVAIAGAIGVAVGLIVRSQLWSVLALVVWMTMLEASIVHYFPGVGRWLPGGADAAIVKDATVHQRLSVAAGLALLLAWVALVAAAGQRRLERHEP